MLQGHGFTCGIDDVLLSLGAESKRAAILGSAEATVLRASAEAAGLASLPVRVHEARRHLNVVAQFSQAPHRV